MMSSTVSEFLGIIQTSWQLDDQLDLSEGLDCLTWRDDHPLASQLTNLCSDKPCSLPFIGKTKINWVTFGGSQEELLETIEDLRCWILPYLGREEPIAVVTAKTATRPQEQALCSAVGWYFRWYCPVENHGKISKRFNDLTALLASRASTASNIPPSLSSLRLEFVACLRTGDWVAATAVVDLIDQWQLDTAKNTQLMRIRLHHEEGDLGSIISIIKHFEVLDGLLPFRLRGVILDTIYRFEILPIENASGWKTAFEHYRYYWQSKLSPYVVAERSSCHNFFLSAYQAYSDCDRETLSYLCASYNMEVAVFMLEALPVVSISQIDVETVIISKTDVPPSIGYSFWGEIVSAVRNGTNTKSSECLSGLTDAVLDDPEWVSVGAETLLEIFTDPLILGNSQSMVVAEGVLVAIIDTVINSRDFPRHEHALVYDSLISAWVAVRGDSSAEQDGQLLLGLVGASLECSATTISDCESAIREWWSKRKILRRLPWLLGALEMLALDHPDTSRLQDLWIDGADLISRLGVSLSKTERVLWRKLGGFVGLDSEFIGTLVAEFIADEEESEVDPLSTLSLRKIALVTLQERPARQAAEELKLRTNAEIIIVTSKSADGFTKSAESADLILFVWASSTHAVYRAFDHVRDKLQYVQGTGPSSIVLAAERWAIQRLSDHLL